MMLEIDADSNSQDVRPRRRRGAAVSGVLPPMVAYTERAAAELRAYLDEQGLENYRVFYPWELDLHGIEDHLAALGEQPAAWEPLPSLVARGECVTQLRSDENRRVK